MEETILASERELARIQTALDEANPQGIHVCLPNPRSQRQIG